MRIGAVVAGVLMAVGLAGCFTADKALLTDANSVAPYSKVTFKSTTSADTTVLTRNGKAYTWKSKDDTLTVRFMAADRANWYVAEMSGPRSDAAGGPNLLYAVIRLDAAAKKAFEFKSFADITTDVGPGLRVCMDMFICIDDVKAYVSSAEKFADGGGKPDETYDVVLEN